MRFRVPGVLALVVASLMLPVAPAPAPAGPTAPVPVAPTGGASVVQPVQLQWAASSGTPPIVAYNWQVASNSTFTHAASLTGSTAASSVGGTGPAAGDGERAGERLVLLARRRGAGRDPIPNVGLVTGPWSAAAAFTVTGSAAGTPARTDDDRSARPVQVPPVRVRPQRVDAGRRRRPLPARVRQRADASRSRCSTPTTRPIPRAGDHRAGHVRPAGRQPVVPRARGLRRREAQPAVQRAQGHDHVQRADPAGAAADRSAPTARR